MSTLGLIIGSTFAVSLMTFVGIIILLFKEELLEKILLILVAFSAGALMGGAFLHLLPETIEKSTEIEIFWWLLGGFVFLFFVEKVLQWHHCHRAKHVHTLGYVNLIADAIHNFTDGIIIAASFIAGTHLGIATTLAIAFHEVPQEIGDFGVLLYSGFKGGKALFLNFLIGLTAIFGGVVGYFISGYVEKFTIFLLPFAAGGFIYIASSDLIPEIRKVGGIKESSLTFVVFLAGILLMQMAKLIFG